MPSLPSAPPEYEVVPQPDGSYSVASGSVTLKFWTVRMGEHDWVCGDEFTGVPCWPFRREYRCAHTNAVLRYRKRHSSAECELVSLYAI